MNEISASQRVDPAPFRVAAEQTGLEVVRDPAVNIAVWRRTLPGWVVTAMAQWLADDPGERTSMELDFGAPGLDCSPLLGAFDDPPLRAWLQQDLLLLGRTLAALSGQPALEATLGAVTTDRCRKFHADYVSLRLVTTYVGPGTEWLPDDAVRRSVLSAPPECHHEANALILREQHMLRRALAGDVLVLKGERGAPGGGAVHRSPPIEATGQARVVLSLTAS